MAIETAYLESYLKSFITLSKATADTSPRWLRELRDEAFSRFHKAGIPTTHNEDWRFTSLADFRQIPFHIEPRERSHPGPAAHAPWNMQNTSACLVFVGGYFVPELSTYSSLPSGALVQSLREELTRHPDRVAEHLGRYLDMDRDPFCALNTAFAEDGAFIVVPRGVVVEHPIHLLFLTKGKSQPAMTHPRNLVVVEAEAQVSIVEEFASIDGAAPSLCNAATELVAGENSMITHSILVRQHERSFHFSTLRIEQARNANVASHSFLVGGALVRNNVHVVLAGEGGECLINGMFIGNGEQHREHHMLVEHASPLCASRQFYNGILDDRAHGVFHGRILVHKGAQKTDAKQTNRNLLLSDNAQIDSKPQLEIHADDVKCTHGATIGQIEEEALFYLRSRGIAEAEARQLLLEAFAGECFERMKPGAARAYIEAAVAQHLLVMAHVGTQQREHLQKVHQ